MVCVSKTRKKTALFLIIRGNVVLYMKKLLFLYKFAFDNIHTAPLKKYYYIAFAQKKLSLIIPEIFQTKLLVSLTLHCHYSLGQVVFKHENALKTNITHRCTYTVVFQRLRFLLWSNYTFFKNNQLEINHIETLL